jgi:hypothetical protein
LKESAVLRPATTPATAGDAPAHRSAIRQRTLPPPAPTRRTNPLVCKVHWPNRLAWSSS